MLLPHTMPDDASGGGGAPHHRGSPPRGATVDKRLVDMPEDLTLEQQSAYIIEKCCLGDAMWTLVWALNKKGANVRWQCKLCDATYTGGPAKIRAHFLANLLGCATCVSTGDERDKANEKAQEHLDEEVRLKNEKDAKRERKRLADEADARQKAKKKQAKMGTASSSSGDGDPVTVDYAKDALERL